MTVPMRQMKPNVVMFAHFQKAFLMKPIASSRVSGLDACVMICIFHARWVGVYRGLASVTECPIALTAKMSKHVHSRLTILG